MIIYLLKHNSKYRIFKAKQTLKGLTQNINSFEVTSIADITVSANEYNRKTIHAQKLVEKSYI